MKRFYSFLIVSVLALSFYGSEAIAATGDPQQGKKLYLTHCAVCHGLEGKGDGTLAFHPPVTDLTSTETQHKSDYNLWKTIHRGGANHVMKTWQWVLSEKDIAMVLAYVRSLAQSSQPQAEGKKF